MTSIKKLLTGLSLISLLMSLSGCLPFMAVHAAKTIKEKVDAPADCKADGAKDSTVPASGSPSTAQGASNAAGNAAATTACKPTPATK